MDDDPSNMLLYPSHPNCSLELIQHFGNTNASLYWNEYCGNGTGTDHMESNGDDGDYIFQFIVLGLGISIVAILGKYSCSILQNLRYS